MATESDETGIKFFMQLRNKPRAEEGDVGSIIDRASGILSQAGNSSISVRSGFLSNFTFATNKDRFSQSSKQTIE